MAAGLFQPTKGIVGYISESSPGDLPVPLASKGEALLCTKNLTTTEVTEEGAGGRKALVISPFTTSTHKLVAPGYSDPWAIPGKGDFVSHLAYRVA